MEQLKNILKNQLTQTEPQQSMTSSSNKKLQKTEGQLQTKLTSNPITLEVFSTSIKILLANCPNLSVDKYQLKVWYELLKDLSNEQLLSAISIFCASHRDVYPGTNIVAYIREYALYDPNELTAGEAWELVRKKRLSRSIYDRSPFPELPPIVQKAFDSVGGTKLLLSENEVADRAHFMKIYDALMEREKMNKMRGFGGETISGLKMLTEKGK